MVVELWRSDGARRHINNNNVEHGEHGAWVIDFTMREKTDKFRATS